MSRMHAQSSQIPFSSWLVISLALTILGAASLCAQPGLILEDIEIDGAGLEDSRATLVTPDGAHVYAVGDSTCIMAASRDDSTGELTFLGQLCEDLASVDGLMANDLAVSPNGDHLYLTDQGLTVLQRETSTGLLSFVERQVDGVGGVQGLDAPSDVVVSADGEFVYAADLQGAVSVFSREDLTGTLNFVQALFDDQGGVDGISDAQSLALSPDGSHLYVASGGLGSADDAVTVFSRDEVSGLLTFVEAYFDGQNGVSGLDHVSAIKVSSDGEHVYVTGSGADAVVTFARNSATGALTFTQALFNGQVGLTLLNSPNGLAVRPDGSVVTVSALGGDAVIVFQRDDMTGTLSLIEEGTNASLGASGIDGPFKITYDPDGEHLYVPSFDEGSPGGVVTLASAPSTGAHTFVQFLDNDTTNNDGLAAVGGAAMSNDGLHFYAVSDGDDAVSHWNRDPMTGRLTLVETIGEEVGGPSSLDEPVVPTLSPDGAHLYVSDLCAPLIVVFDRDAVTGTLTFASELEPQASGTLESMAISPDGLFLYAGDTDGDSVLVYGRDPVTGALTFLQSLTDGVDAEGIDRPESMVLSADGAHLYVGGRSDNAIARFSRDAVTGLLTFIDQIVDDTGGVNGLDTVQDLAFSPDGAQLYAASIRDDSIAVFSRDAVTGALIFVQALVDGEGGVDGLDGAQTVTVSQDGQLVLVGSDTIDRAVALFYRDPVNGSLRFAERVDGPFDSAANQVRDLVVSPDGAHLYSMHPNANAVAIYGMPMVLFADGFESGDISRWSDSLQ